MGNWILFFAAALLVFMNFFVSLTILPLYVMELGGSEFHSGLQSTLFFLAAVLLRLYFGPLADSKGRKLPLLIGAFVFATSPLLFLASTSILSLTLARIYQAIGLATFLSSGSSLVADMAPAEKTGSYIGKYRVLINVALLAGPAMALAIISSRGYHSWFIISALMGALALGLLLFVKAPPLPPVDVANPLEQMAFIRKNRQILWALGGVALTSLGYGIIITFTSIYIERGAFLANAGIYFTLLGLGGIAANLTAGLLVDRLSPAAIAWPSIMLLGAGTACLLLVPGAPLLFLILSSLLAGMGYSGALVALITWLVEAAGPKARATTLAFQESTIDLSIAVGTFFFGISGSLLGLPVSFGLAGLLIFLAALKFFLTASSKTASSPPPSSSTG